jgi:hypothetical protein
MFGLFKHKRPVVFEQWIVSILDFSSDTAKFYEAVEAELKTWEVPEMRTERLTFKDGGFLSSEREYLRVRRESLVFDICSARFGRSWWFSSRSAVLPRSLRWWEVFVFCGAVAGLVAAYCTLFGAFFGGLVIGASLLAVLLMMMLADTWNGLDDMLLGLPVIGAFYEVIFRAESYYRDDARRMYVSVVDFLVREKVREFALANGIEDVQFNDVKDVRQLTSLLERVHGFISQTAEQVLPSSKSK